MKNTEIATNTELPVVKSISRASSVLYCLSEGISTLTDIAGHCKLSKSTVHRILKALEESNLAMQDSSNHNYYLGPLITRLISNPRTIHEHLVTCAVEEIGRLSDIIEETVTLSVLVAIRHIPVYEIQSKHDLRVAEESKRLGPLYAGAGVKVLLSQLSDEELSIVKKHIKIVPVTGNTVTDWYVLMEQFKEIRKQGYAVTYAERIAGTISVSAPVKNYTYPAAVSILGPESRLKTRVKDVVKELLASADKISDNIAEIYHD
jgi:DNA-binding IclR family transcriptional regulator